MSITKLVGIIVSIVVVAITIVVVFYLISLKNKDNDGD